MAKALNRSFTRASVIACGTSLIATCIALTVVYGLGATTLRAGPFVVILAVNIALALSTLFLGTRLVSQSHVEEGCVADSIPAMAWTLTPSGELQEVNPRFEAYTGKTVAEIRADPTAVLHPDDALSWTEQCHRSRRSGEEFDGEFRYLKSDGTYRWFETRARPIREPEGGLKHWVCIAWDIDERKQSELAVRQREAHLREILDNLPCQIAAASAEGRHDYANQRHLDYLGISLDNLDDAGWLNVVHPDDREAVATEWAGCVAARRAMDIDHRMRRWDGEFHWFHAQVEPVFDAAGRIIRWYGVITDIERWKVSENSLRDSENTLRTTIDAVPALVWRTDASGNVDYLNKRCVEYHGQSEAEQGTNVGWSALLHPDEKELIVQQWLAAVATRSPFDHTYRFRRKDGVYRWMRVRGAPFFAEDGRVLSWYGTHTDVHEQKLAEEALQESERRLSLILETIPAMVWRANEAGDIDYINERCIDNLGLDIKDFQSYGWLTLVHPQDVEATLQRWHQARQERRPYEAICRFRYRDGVYRWFKAAAAPLYDRHTGDVTSWYGVHVDIDEQKRAEDAVIQREQQLRKILDTIPCLAWSATPDGAPTYVNQRLTEYTGQTFADFSDQGWLASVHPDELDSATKAWRYSAATGEPYRLITRYRRFDGFYSWFDVRANALLDEEGRVICWYGINFNIDDSKKLEGALRAAQAELARASQVATVGELSASIAHEINQPLAAVVFNGAACLRWLDAASPNLDRARRTVENIVRDGTSAAAIVTRIRSLFKHTPPDRVVADVNVIIREVLQLMQDERDRHSITVVTELSDDLPRVMVDKVQVQQVLTNLVQNGIDAMDSLVGRAKSLMIRSFMHDADMVTVEVRDRGTGIPDFSKMFEPFFTTKSKGLGVGLSVCRSIVESHGGRIWAMTGHGGDGTILSFTLPIAHDVIPALRSEASV